VWNYIARRELCRAVTGVICWPAGISGIDGTQRGPSARKLAQSREGATKAAEVLLRVIDLAHGGVFAGAAGLV
jgi:hypothetical protein